VTRKLLLIVQDVDPVARFGAKSVSEFLERRLDRST
jgi:hypothetical protein